MLSSFSIVRTRYAPSPTGPLHIGGARSALFNYLFAKKHEGKFILRIEDTDEERSDLKWIEDITETLKWLGIKWDEGPDIGGPFGPYKQSQRLEIYEKYLKILLDKNKAYYCFCTREELEEKRQYQLSLGKPPRYDGTCASLSVSEVNKRLEKGVPFVIRFRVPAKKVSFIDLIRKKIEFDGSLLGDIVIAKNLKSPLYNFAAAVDDYEMQISHVIRGEEHLANTPKQILIQKALGFSTPFYAHLPLVLAPDRSKLSKRFGAVSVLEYKEAGYLPEALINFMVLLGWNPDINREIFSLNQLIKEFSLEKIQKAGAIFNISKLDFFNSYYIRQKPTKKLVELCIPYLKKAGLLVEGQFSQEALEKIIEVSKFRMKKISEINELADFFFLDKLKYEKEMFIWDKMTFDEVKDALLLCDKILTSIGKWEREEIERKLNEEIPIFNQKKGYPIENKGFVLWPLRVALSGKKASPSPFEIAEILGKEKCLKRIKDALAIF